MATVSVTALKFHVVFRLHLLMKIFFQGLTNFMMSFGRERYDFPSARNVSEGYALRPIHKTQCTQNKTQRLQIKDELMKTKTKTNDTNSLIP